MSNLKKIIKEFEGWIKRFEEQGINWSEIDWINWGLDITSAIVDIYGFISTIVDALNGLGINIIEEIPNLIKDAVEKELYS